MGAIEEIMKPGEPVALCLLVGVRVDLQCHGQPGVAEDDLGIAGRDAQVLQERGDRMPDVVNRDHVDVVLLADAPEGADEVPGPDRAATLARLE